MNRLLLGGCVAVFGLIGCSDFAPSVPEADSGVGSNTNWFRSCDADSECGEDLGCICGTCSRRCAGDDECGEGTCPVDRGAFIAQCGAQVALESAGGTCFEPCEENADCPDDRICVAGGCAVIAHDPCEQAKVLSFEAPTENLRARVGALFGDQFYEPQWYPSYPEGWEEPYQPSELIARVLDEEGQPVVGCRVEFLSDESSGHGYAQDARTNDDGEVSALWVAGTAEEQSLRAAVRGADQWLFAELNGEARRHDEAPTATGPQAVSYTAPSGLVVEPSPSEPGAQVRIGFTPLTFPARITYTPFETDRLSIEFTNASSDDPAETEVSSGDRLLSLHIPDQGAESGAVIAILQSAYCVYESPGLGFTCQYSDAWEPGEFIQLRVEARTLATGETPDDYDSLTHSQEPCGSTEGCTDFSVLVQRGNEAWERIAVLRSVGVEDFSERSLSISGVYTPEMGIGPTCLQTHRASFLASQEVLIDGDWVWSDAGTSWASHDTWRNQTCANYAAFAVEEGFFVSTGGPSPISTPNLPGVAREL